MQSEVSWLMGSELTNASTNGRREYSTMLTHSDAGCRASVEKRGRSRRRCCRILCRLDSRQAAAKRADRDRRARTPHSAVRSRMGSFSQTACPYNVSALPTPLARGSVSARNDVAARRDGAGLQQRRHRRLTLQRRAAAAVLVARCTCVQSARCTVSVPKDGWWRSSGDAHQNAPTSHHSHTI